MSLFAAAHSMSASRLPEYSRIIASWTMVSSRCARVVACRSFLEATGLLKGLGVQVTVNNQLPTDLAGINELLVKQARSVLANDPELRKIFTAVIAEIEEGVNENGERTEPVLQ